MDIQPALTPPPQKKKRVRWRFYLAGLLAIGFVFYFFQPNLTSWWLRRDLTRKALGHSWLLTFGKVEADFFTGQAFLKDVRLQDERQPANQMICSVIEIDFSPWLLLFKPNRSPVGKVILGKGRIDWNWIAKKSARPVKETEDSRRNHFPAALVGSELSASLECGGTKVTIENADFNFLPNAAGEVNIPKLTATCASRTRSFTNLEGVTAIKDRGLYVGGVRLDDDLVLERGAIDFNEPEKKKITSDFQFSAFGGQWRTDVDFDLRKSPIKVEAGASFWNLSINQLGKFLDNRDFAEGMLHEGRFTFRGSPLEPAKSNMSLRLNATDFRWQERHWNSLIFSALLVNRRLDIPQFELVQDKNQIKLSGQAELGGKWTRIPDEFQLQVLAQIDDLNAAARIIFPGQKSIAGEAFFAGEIRNQNGKFSGNLKMRGGPLQISGVAIDRVRGDLDLHGSEVSANALEFARHDDTATGWATLNLAGTHLYSAELEVTAGDVADYSAILPKAVSDHAAGGGINLWWSGDGTTAVHSGAFKASLHNFLLSRENNAVPLDVISHGSYSPAGITFNKLVVQRPNIKLDTTVVVRPDSMELRDLRITGSGGSLTSGNLILPINVFSALNNPTLASLLDSSAAASGHVVGTKVSLDEICELSGRRPPIRGRTTFDFTADGPLQKLTSKLEISLDDFLGPGKLAIPSLTAQLSLAENHFSTHGEINRDEPRDGLKVDLDCTTLLTQENLVKNLGIDSTAEISGSIKAARFAISLLHPWLPFSQTINGDVGGVLLLGGTSAQPIWNGNLALLQTSWQPAWLDHPLQKITGTIALQNDRLSTDKISGNYRGGSFSLSGSSGWNAGEEVNLTIEGKSLPLSSRSDPSEAVIDAAVRLQGPESTRNLTGTITFKSATLHRELEISKPSIDLPVVSRFSLPWISPDWVSDLSIKATQPLEIRGRNSAWLVNPDLNVSGSARTPQLLGKLTIRPFALAKKADAPGDEIIFYFPGSPLENGVASDFPPFDDASQDQDGFMGKSHLIEQSEGHASSRLEIFPILRWSDDRSFGL